MTILQSVYNISKYYNLIIILNFDRMDSMYFILNNDHFTIRVSYGLVLFVELFSFLKDITFFRNIFFIKYF